MFATTKFLYFSLAFLVFLSFSWGVKKHFRSSTMPRGMITLSIASLIAFALYGWQFLHSSPELIKSSVGALLHLSAGWIFFSAVAQTKRRRLSLAYDTDKPEFVITTGPYRIVRHPFYLSYIIFWIGCTVAAWSFNMLMMTAAISALYVVAARREEAKFGNSAMASSYKLYSKTAGLLWPKIGKAQ